MGQAQSKSRPSQEPISSTAMHTSLFGTTFSMRKNVRYGAGSKRQCSRLHTRRTTLATPSAVQSGRTTNLLFLVTGMAQGTSAVSTSIKQFPRPQSVLEILVIFVPNPTTEHACNPDWFRSPRSKWRADTESEHCARFNASDPNVQGLLGMIPLPTRRSSGAEFYNTLSLTPNNWREELIRVDHNLSDKERLTFRFIHDSWETLNSVPLWTNGGRFQRSRPTSRALESVWFLA